MIYYEFTIAWWIWLLLGFCLGVYVHSSRIHHTTNWLAIKILSGLIWFLRKTDPIHTAASQTKINPPSFKGKSNPRLEQEELEDLLSLNPDLSVVKRGVQ